MLDWTGERFLPWTKEATVAYEHLHRYLWASNLVKNKRVLDLASGEGYGASILAAHASFVCGVDIDNEAVHHAAEKYRRPNLQFLHGDITRVPISAGHSFDVIVCFEAIEHIQEHEQLLREAVRLLTPEGLFIVSTPNKEIYRADEEPNPFHVKELTLAEFGALLEAHFSNVQYLGQRVHPGSTLWPLGKPCAAGDEFAVARVDAEFRRIPQDQRVAEYFVAVASKDGVQDLAGSVLMDHSDELLHEKDRERDDLQKQVIQRDEALAWREGQVEVLEREKRELLEGIESARKESAGLREELAKIHASRSWRVLSKLRSFRKKW